MAKVLVVAPYVPHPARHGGAIRSRVLLDALRQDHEVHFAAAVAHDDDLERLATLGAQLGIAVHPLPAHDRRRARPAQKLLAWFGGRSELAQRRWRLGDARRQLATIARGLGTPVTVADSSWTLPLFAGGPAHVLFLHNLEHAMFARAEAGRRGFGDRLTRRCEARGLRNLEQQAVRAARLTIAVSEHDRGLALGLAASANVAVVPNTVDVEALPLAPVADPRAAMRLLFVGSLDYPPNLEAVTELCERHLPVLRAAFPGLTVRLVGKDPHLYGVRFLGTPGVEVVGPVDDLAPHYRDTHAVYLPIRSGGGTRIKILEAWAFGVPVLSTAVGAEGLPAIEGEHLLRFETPDEGVACLRELCGGDRAARLQASGRALVERQFSHRAAIVRLRDLFSGLPAAPR